MRQSPFTLKASAARCAASFFIASALAGCSRKEAEPPPVLSPWAEQAAAAERAVRERGGDLMLTDVGASPTRQPGQPAAPGGAIELKVSIYFASPKATQRPDEGRPAYEMFSVKFNDHRLATTLRVEGARRVLEDEKIPGGLSAVRVGPQDVLKATLAEGESYMAEPVDAGNIYLGLLQPSSTPPDLKGRVVWQVIYYRTPDDTLSILVDAQTGATVKRETGTKKGETGATPSPTSKP